MRTEIQSELMLIEVGSSYPQTLGADRVSHSGRTLTEHLHGTHALLSVWKQAEALCMAGLLHSLYATASGKQLLPNPPRRDTLVWHFGSEIESLVFGYSRYQQIWAVGHAPQGALQAQLSIVYLANLVDQTIYMPKEVAPRMVSHLLRVRPSLPAEVTTWMDDFMPMLSRAL